MSVRVLVRNGQALTKRAKRIKSAAEKRATEWVAPQTWWRNYQIYLESDHWKAFRAKILNERKHCCENCKSSERLQIHHITYERLGAELPTDVAVLCKPCHKRTHRLLGKRRRR